MQSIRLPMAVLIASIGGIACSDKDMTERDELVQGQALAHQALAYIAGNDSVVFDDEGLMRDLDELRWALLDETAVMLPSYRSTINGLSAVIYPVYGSSERYHDVAALIDQIAAGLTALQPHAGDFFSLDLGQHCDEDGQCFALRGIDPSPLRLSSSLDNTAGALGYATYEGTFETTRALNWSYSWNSNATFNADPTIPGTPCRNSGGSVGDVVEMIIWKNDLTNKYACR